MRTGPSCPPEVLAFSATFFSPPTDKRPVCRPARLLNPGCFLKQDVCLRPPSPQINNPQNLISGGRVEALESHYFHIPYPGALGLLRECGRPGTGKAEACSGNLRLSARLQGERPSLGGSLRQNRGSLRQGTGSPHHTMGKQHSPQ